VPIAAACRRNLDQAETPLTCDYFRLLVYLGTPWPFQLPPFLATPVAAIIVAIPDEADPDRAEIIALRTSIEPWRASIIASMMVLNPNWGGGFRSPCGTGSQRKYPLVSPDLLSCARSSTQFSDIYYAYSIRTLQERGFLSVVLHIRE
jgi:hypothetical protein